MMEEGQFFLSSSGVPKAAPGWQPIATLPKRSGPRIVLWNPCDGIHVLPITADSSRLEVIRRGGVFTHWRWLDAPMNVRP